MTPIQKNLVGLTFQEIEEIILTLGEKKFRANQIWQYIYLDGHKDFSLMTSLGKSLRLKLSQDYNLNRLTIKTEQLALDKTHKFLFSLEDNKEIEAVYIPTKTRNTICVSSQVGCNMGCTFCNTGTQKLVRNLTSTEIINQILTIKEYYSDFNKDENRKITNIVFMGMGEPLQNYKEVLKSLQILNDANGLSISKRKITLSTCGIVPMMEKLAQDMPVNLALSLHGATDEIRSKIMPINNKYPLKELITACNNYYQKSNTKKITLEYIMIKGLNDKLEDAKELLKIAKQIPCKINLIPFHPWAGSPFEAPSKKTIYDFGEFLNANYITTTARLTRGDDILAACGQLKSKSQKTPKTPISL
jgi:23S rRNA (adenine2503-C2)-methyltransferase